MASPESITTGRGLVQQGAFALALTNSGNGGHDPVVGSYLCSTWNDLAVMSQVSLMQWYDR